MFDLTNLKPRQIEFPLVSVVVPCYNVEQYIDQCLNSVLDNGYPNVEVICVDDHSTDKTVEHIQNLMRSHFNVQLYDNGADHNIYGGACRNIGMSHAKGKYIYFCDSDDYVLPGLFQTCVSKCDSLGADMCMFKFQCVNQTGRLSRPGGIDFNFILDRSKETFDHHGTKNILTMGCICAWNKFFNRDFIVEIGAKFQETKNSNDQVFVAAAELKARRIAALCDVLYVHRCRTKTSVQMDRFRGGNQYDILQAFRGIFELAKKSSDPELALKQFEGHVYAELRYMVNRKLKFSSDTLKMACEQMKGFGIYHRGVKAMLDSMRDGQNISSSTCSECGIKDVWSMFDKIVCIHYLPYKDRVDGITEQLKRVGILDLPQFEWCYTVDNKFSGYLMDAIPPDKINKRDVCDRNIKYTIDSYVLLKRLQFMGYRRVLILEDDIVFHKDLNFIRDVVQSTPQDFDVMNYDPFVGRRKDKHPIVRQVGRYVQRYQDLTVYNMSCCALSGKAICRIVQHQEKCLNPFDHYTWAETEDLNTYCVTRGNNICIQDLDGHQNKQSRLPTTHSKYPRINIENYWKGEEPK